VAEGADRFLELSDAQLDALIGEHLLEGDFGAKDVTAAEKQRIGASWFESRRDEFRQSVCTSQAVRVYVGQSGATEKELADAVVGALAFLAGGPVPVALLAAKVLRFGLTRLCPDLVAQGAAGSPHGG
jgi:hypothetical protein